MGTVDFLPEPELSSLTLLALLSLTVVAFQESQWSHTGLVVLRFDIP